MCCMVVILLLLRYRENTRNIFLSENTSMMRAYPLLCRRCFSRRSETDTDESCPTAARSHTDCTHQLYQLYQQYQQHRCKKSSFTSSIPMHMSSVESMRYGRMMMTGPQVDVMSAKHIQIYINIHNLHSHPHPHPPTSSSPVLH